MHLKNEKPSESDKQNKGQEIKDYNIMNNNTIKSETNQEKIEVIQGIQENVIPEHIKLFRTIFKGREDIVPEYWKSNRKENKSGYSPLCRNKWNQKLCNLIKNNQGGCQKCKNKDYILLSDDLIKKHITGQTILGVYPLLKSNTCYFIAADFDKHKSEDPNPFDNMKKYVEVCEVQEFPCYVFRSKSGKGFHVYIFFSVPVPAWKARIVSFALLEEAGVIIGENVELSSFDRLFPNQDQLSGKGFGNLISLPFQGKAGKKENTLILNPETDFQKSYADQWKILTEIKRVDENGLDSLIKEWNLKRKQLKKKDYEFEPIREEKKLAVFSRIEAGCKFIKHCYDDSETLPEPEWYAFLTIIGRCKDGRNQAHKFSEDYPKYSYEDTEDKLEHALNDTGPYRCETIENEINSKYCKKCTSRGRIESPILLGYNKTNDKFYDDIIKNINEKHAVIMIGGKCHILNEVIEPVFNRLDITLSTVADFRNFYANQLIPQPQNSNKEISKADYWFKHKERRQYKGIVFDPSGNISSDVYNLWKGFVIKPKKGDWSFFQEHIYKNIASNDDEIYKYIVVWLARIVQDPGGKRPGVAIVLRGKQGTGKGVFVNTFGRLLGKHYIQIAQSSQVTGRFNSHFKDVLLAFVDEGFWAGDKQAEGTIKNIITESFITIEQKGKDVICVKNNVNFIFASNNDWIIPAGLEERRFFVLDVSDKHQQDNAYFKVITNQMENQGGLEAMLFDLLEVDISSVNLRNFKQTKGLFEQKLHSMNSEQKYWFERLYDGKLLSNQSTDNEQYSDYTGQFDWSDEIYTEDQYNDYLAFTKKLNIRYPLTPQQFGIALNKMCKNIKKHRPWRDRKRKHVRIFPPLEECRKEFEMTVKTAIDWDDDDSNIEDGL